MASNSQMGQSSSQPQVPIPHLQDKIYQTIFKELLNFKLVPTQYLDHRELERYDLMQTIARYLGNIGWEAMEAIRCPVYREPTLEFLASFSYKEPKTPQDDYTVRFQMGRRIHKRTLAMFNVELGFETTTSILTPNYQGALLLPPSTFEAADFWASITSAQSGYDPHVSMASEIIDLSLRVMHHWLAHSITGCRKSKGVVSHIELFMLWCMCKRHRLNAGYQLLLTCQKMRQMVRENQQEYIIFGSFISKLAISLQMVPKQPIFPMDMVPIGEYTLLMTGVICRGQNGLLKLSELGEDEEKEPKQQKQPLKLIKAPKVEQLTPQVHQIEHLLHKIDKLALEVTTRFDRQDQQLEMIIQILQQHLGQPFPQ